MEDTAIIDLYWLRSEDAIRETAAKYGAYCRSIARGLLANAQDEEECVSDTWIRAWNAMPDERPNRLKLFLGKITRRLACDVLRSRTAQKRGGGQTALALDELSEVVSGGETPEGAMDRQALRAALDGFLAGLPERSRSLFLRRYWYLDSVEQLAKRFGMSKTQATTTLHRLRQKLRAHLEQEGFDL